MRTAKFCNLCLHPAVESGRTFTFFHGGGMKHIPVFIFLLICLVPARVFPQTEQIVARTFTTLHGLPSKRVQAIHQDSSGNVWVGTDGGLSLLRNDRFYDPVVFSMWGEKLKVSVNAIASGRSKQDMFIAGSNSGATAYLYRSIAPLRDGLSEFSVLPELSNLREKDVEFLSALESSRSEVLFGSRNGGLWIRNSSVNRADNFSFRAHPLRRLLTGSTITSLVETPSGEIWIGTTRGLLRYVDTSLAAIPSVLSMLSNAHITVLHVDRNGVLWVGTKAHGVVRFNNGTRTVYNGMSILAENHITSITSVSNGDVWFGTVSKGLLRLRRGMFTGFSGHHSLPSDSILCMYADAENVLWVGTPEGVTKIFPVSYHYFSAKDGMPPEGFVCGLKSRSGALWFGGYGVLGRFDKWKQTFWRATGALARERFEQMLEDSTGALWITTEQGVIRFENGAFSLHRDPLLSRFEPIDLKLAPDGGLYLLTAKAIKLLRNGVFHPIAESEPGEPFLSMALDREGRLWVRSNNLMTLLTLDSVVTRQRFEEGGRFAGDIALSPDGSVDVFENELGFVSGNAFLSGTLPKTRSRGYAWNYMAGFRSLGGKRYLIDRDGILIQHGSARPGGERIIRMRMALDEQLLERLNGDHLLMNVEGFTQFHPGLGTLSLQLLYDELFLPKLLRDYDVRRQPYERASLLNRRRLILEDMDGSLWVGSSGGVQVLSSQAPEDWSPRAIITEIRAGEESFLPGRYTQPAGRMPTLNERSSWWPDRRSGGWGDLRGFTEKDHLVLPSFNNDLEFRFYLPTNRKEMGVLYQYQLEGVDTAWSELQTGEAARYINVSQGTYRFRLRAVGPEGRFSLEQQVQVSVLIPFWRARWFWLLGMITITYVAGRWYVLRIRALKEEHARITKEAIQQSELKMARTLQLGMLPERCPEIPGFVLAARSLPASDVGGDFYDFLQMHDHQVAIAVGDVSGHGITGAMIVGMARTSIRFASTEESGPARVLSIANERLRQDITKNIFVAMFYGILDPEEHLIRYICAGQPTPILVRDGKAEFIPHGKGDRFPLGILSGVHYSEERLTMAPGDTLVFYTDGIVEAMNAEKEEFGFDRLKQLLARCATLQPDVIIDTLLNELERFGGTAEQNDDITIVVLQYRNRGQL